MVVEVYEVRDRIAAQVASLNGYGEADAPFDPIDSPHTYADRPFAVAIPSTEENGTRDRSTGAMEVVTTVVVEVHAPVSLTGPNRIMAATEEYKREPVLIKRLMSQGEEWSYGLRVAYRSTTRAFLPGDEWLQTRHTFLVRHQVQL